MSAHQPRVGTIERERRIRLWIDALRSERYQQAQGALRTGGGYCCLGVACEVYRLETGLGEWRDRDAGDLGDPFLDGVANAADDVAMPAAVAEWLLGDPDEFDPDVDTPQGFASLSDLNDNGATFVDIAWWLEEQVLPERIAAEDRL